MAKREILIWFNVITRKLQDSNGYNVKTTAYEGATLDEKPMMHLQLVQDTSNTAYTKLSDLDAHSGSIDTDFDIATNLMTKTFNADINQPGEWKDGGTALASLGQFSIPLDMKKAEVTSRLGKLAKLTTSRFELKIIDTSADFVFKVIFPFITYNLQDNNGTVGPAPEDDYYDKTEVDGLLNGKVNIILSGYTAKPVLAGTEYMYIDDAGVSKQCLLSAVTALADSTGVEQECADDTPTPINLFDKTIYRRCEVVFTIDDGTNIIDYVYKIDYNDSDVTDDGGDAFVSAGSLISGVAVSFDVSGDN